MIERQMGDSKNAHGDDQKTEEIITAQVKPKKVTILRLNLTRDTELGIEHL